MSTLLFDGEVVAYVSKLLVRAERACAEHPQLSPFFVAFWLYDDIGVSPFVGLTQGQKDEGLLCSVQEVPSTEYDSHRFYANVLLEVLPALKERKPNALVGSYFLLGNGVSYSRDSYPATPFALYSSVLELAKQHYQELIVSSVESDFVQHRVLARQMRDYSRYFFKLKKAVEALQTDKLMEAGILLGSLSPTLDVGTWRRGVVQRALYEH